MGRWMLGLTACAVSMTAVAGDENSSEGLEIQYEERTIIEFDGVKVDGTVIGPDGTWVFERRRAEFNPMVRLRENFVPEMIASVNDVK